jgi:hypothetical protein
MNYKPVPKQYGPTLDTEYGSYTSPYFTYDPNQYMFRQPGAPQALVSTRHPVVNPPAVNSIRAQFLTSNEYQRGSGLASECQRGSGLAAEFTPEPSTANSPLTGFLFALGAFGLLYLLTRGSGARKNPMISVDVPASALEGAFHERAAYREREAPRRRRRSSKGKTRVIRGRRYSANSLKKLRSTGRKVARAMHRDERGRFVSL